MIFKSVSRLDDKTQTAFFVEQVQVYIRLVDVYCEKNGINRTERGTYFPIEELKLIGLIENENELALLKKVLGSLYEEFIDSVRFAAEHRKEMGGVLDKLYNSERKKQQVIASQKLHCRE